MENLVNRIEGVNESFIFGRPVSDDKDDIKINVKLVIDKEIIKDVYKIEGTDEEIKEVLSSKIKEINKTMPPYKAIRGIIISEEPLIRTTTNKIKRQANLDEIENLRTKVLARNVLHFKTIDSTQSEVWRLINKNAPSGTIVIADIQTAGKGTHGRIWHTDNENNIAFSFLYN